MNQNSFPEKTGNQQKNPQDVAQKSDSSIILVPFCFFSPSSILTPQVSVYFEYLKFNTPAKKTNRLSTSPLFFGGSTKVMTPSSHRHITGGSPTPFSKTANIAAAALPGGQRMPYQFRFRRALRRRWGRQRGIFGHFPHGLSWDNGNP